MSCIPALAKVVSIENRSRTVKFVVLTFITLPGPPFNVTYAVTASSPLYRAKHNQVWRFDISAHTRKICQGAGTTPPNKLFNWCDAALIPDCNKR